jgi:hypothetical protein
MTKTISISLILLAMASAPVRAEVADGCFEKMPFGCFLTKSDTMSKDQTDAIAKKLGTPLRRLSKTYLQVQGKPIQVNILEAKSITDAKKLHKTISATKGHPAFCLIQGKKVVEFCNAELSTAIKTTYELGFTPKPKKVQYGITAHISTIDEADYMAFNKLFNVFLKTNTQNPSRQSITQIRSLSRDFTFGTSVVLRKPSDKSTSYVFNPKPTKITDQSHDHISYFFTQPPDVLSIPYVTLTAKIVCNDTGLTPTDRKADKSLLSATPYWPVDDPQIQALAKRITPGKQTREAKVQAILEWLTPGKNIKSDGPTGSRWGVKKVLKQKYGHCWDSSDCFVTLARASGIPSRQLGGWLYGTSGHIWAEVLTEEGWKQVDPTGGGKLDCGIYHIPYFTTETGEMPILYLSMPQIEIVEMK